MILSRDILESLIVAAALAPSADNNQPWAFQLGEGFIDVFHDLSRALSSDVDGMFDHQSIGAAIESIVIAATRYQASALVNHVQSADSGLPYRRIARVTFESRSPTTRSDPLLEGIVERHTDRRPYQQQPIDSLLLNELANECKRLPGCRIIFIDDKRKIAQWASYIRDFDQMRFELQAFHQELFERLHFDASSMESMRFGLDVRCLELPHGVRKLLKMLSYWPLMKGLNATRLTRILVEPMRQLTLKSGALALLVVDTTNPESSVISGRALMRVWTLANLRAVSVHPLGSLPILLRKAGSQDNGLSARQSRIASAAQTIVRDLGVGDSECLALLLRIGYRMEGLPSHRSIRLPVERLIIQLRE